MSKADGIGFGAWKAFERFFHGYFEIVTALALSFYLLSVTLSHSLASGCFVLVRRLSGLSFGQFHGSFCYFCLLSFFLHKVSESIGDFSWSVLCLATRSLLSSLHALVSASPRDFYRVFCAHDFFGGYFQGCFCKVGFEFSRGDLELILGCAFFSGWSLWGLRWPVSLVSFARLVF